MGIEWFEFSLAQPMLFVEDATMSGLSFFFILFTQCLPLCFDYVFFFFLRLLHHHHRRRRLRLLLLLLLLFLKVATLFFPKKKR